MRILAVWMVLAGPVWAGDWRAGVAEDLTGRALVYEAGAVQDSRASGRTLYNASELSWGYWEMRDGRYCSQWPPSRDWECYDLSVAGDQVRFVDEWGNESIGRYTD